MMDLISLFLPSFPRTLVYMLQSTEYQSGAYLRWFWRTGDFTKVAKRRSLHMTLAARLLYVALVLGIAVQITAGGILIWHGLANDVLGATAFGSALLLSYPMAWALFITVPLVLGRIFIVKPKEKRLIAQSRHIFAKHSGTKIAVAGSYGKTTMKELLGTVLAEGKSVAITPANKNVAISHAYFAKKLAGDEDVLVIEYGEGKPGDVARFAHTTQPNMGVITGLAPAHLEAYPTLQAAGEDIFSLADYLQNKNVYVNAESEAAQPFIKKGHIAYDARRVGEWKISNIQVSLDGVRFSLTKGDQKLQLHSGLLGRHQVGPLAAVAVIADSLGLSKQQIQAGLGKTVPFEHRMQPRHINGAWVLDDTYNGNIDGIKAGLALLKELPAKRKMYVTPGLVDQGVETQAVHQHMGKLIADAKPDKVVLMQNSATKDIQTGLQAGNYPGELHIEDQPLEFYTNLNHYIAAGDLVLMQNDWTDNYA